MAARLKSRTGRALLVIIALIPWLAAMFLFYWLHTDGVWTSATPHRGKMSVGLLATGMAVSFAIFLRLGRRE